MQLPRSVAPRAPPQAAASPLCLSPLGLLLCSPGPVPGSLLKVSQSQEQALRKIAHPGFPRLPHHCQDLPPFKT